MRVDEFLNYPLNPFVAERVPKKRERNTMKSLPSFIKAKAIHTNLKCSTISV